MRASLVKLLLDGKGRFVSLATGALVAAVTKALAAKNVTLDPEIENYISGLAGFFVMWVIDSVVLKLQSTGVKAIQDALPPNIVSDGVAGEKTVAAVEKAVADSLP